MQNSPDHPDTPTTSAPQPRTVVAALMLAGIALLTISKALPNAAHMSASLADVAHVYALEGLK